MDDEIGDLAFLPLGGTGEIGMNLNLYRCNGRWLAVDCGIGFGGPEHPEVDIMVPDPGYIADRRDRLLGLVITHAHEDHIGAVAHLWPQLRCPVYATPVRRRGAAPQAGRGATGQPGEGARHPARRQHRPRARSSLRFIRMSHSIPEAQSLAIETPYGMLLHTGDWKMDPQPLVGPTTDEAALAELGERGVLAMICDSTNAMVEGHSGSEHEVRTSLCRADPRHPWPHRGDLLRQQRRARGDDRPCRARSRPQRRRGRPLACATWTPPRANAAT